jgi:hypothetical protein
VATSSQFILDRIAALEAQIVALEAAILAFYTSGAAQEYRLDTSQTAVRVERSNISEMERVLAALVNQHQVYCVRNGTASGAHNSRSGW